MLDVDRLKLVRSVVLIAAPPDADYAGGKAREADGHVTAARRAVEGVGDGLRRGERGGALERYLLGRHGRGQPYARGKPVNRTRYNRGGGGRGSGSGAGRCRRARRPDRDRRRARG